MSALNSNPVPVVTANPEVLLQMDKLKIENIKLKEEIVNYKSQIDNLNIQLSGKSILKNSNKFNFSFFKNK